jgi:hypothetical protein
METFFLHCLPYGYRMHAISGTGSVTIIMLEKDGVGYKMDLIIICDTWI